MADNPDVEGSGQQKPSHSLRNNQHKPQGSNYWAPPMRQQHHKEHQPPRPSESVDLTTARGATNG